MKNKEVRCSVARCPPRSENTQQDTGKEPKVNPSMNVASDAKGIKLQGRPDTIVARQKGKIRSCRDSIMFGTWNVRTMNQSRYTGHSQG